MVDDRSDHATDFSEIPRTRSAPDDDELDTAQRRDLDAGARDLVSDVRDQVANIRDLEAERRDRYAEARDRFDGRFNAAAASDRLGSSRDRDAGSSDRNHSAADRQAAASYRAVGAQDRVGASIDKLTGAYRRDEGMAELERETSRANRTHASLVLAFVDVDGLKATNDSLGHAAGDQLLRHVVKTLRDNFRSYDVIVRFGGDEFLCALPGLGPKTVAERFALINATLRSQARGSISVGLAYYRAHDSLDALISRADDALRAARARRRPLA